MKIVLLAILLGGCATTRDYKTVTHQIPEYGVESIDVGHGVICFSVTDKDNLGWSCVKIK